MFLEKLKNIINFFDNRGLDSLFLACVTSLIIIGLVMVTSSTVDFAATKFSNPLFFFKKQLIFIILGLVILYVITHIKTKFYYDYGKYFLLLSLIISLLVHIPGLGVTINGATRWINLGFFTLQVSEVSRLFFFIWLSGYISRNDFNKNYLKIFLFLSILMLAIVSQRDFGSMILLFVAFIIFSFLSHVQIKHLLKVLSLAIIPILLLIVMYPYRIQRLLAFISPWDDPQGSGYQIIASQIALSSGGYFGQGLGSSMQKLFYLPEQYNDFILAIIGEELGFIFLIFILLLYVIIFWRIIIFYKIIMNFFIKQIISILHYFCSIYSTKGWLIFCESF